LGRSATAKKKRNRIKTGVRDITNIIIDYTAASSKAFTTILSDKEQNRLMPL